MNNKHIILYQTSDTHGYIYPHTYSDNTKANQGLGTLCNLIRNRNKENSILIDTGDTIQGSPLMYYQAAFQDDDIMSEVFNHIEYDYFTIGNHEFNYGKEYLHKYISNLNGKVLNSNILKNNKPLYGVPYDIKTLKDGFKIALIGATTHYIPNWEQPKNIEDITFKDAFTAVKETVFQLKETEKPDVIVVNYHGGLEIDPLTLSSNTEYTGENQGFKMMDEIEGIDILLTGHQHKEYAAVYKNTAFTQPSAYGKSLAQIDITYKKTGDKFTVLDIIPTLIPNDGGTIDKDVEAITENLESKTQEWLDSTISTTTENLLFTDQIKDRIHKHPLASFINQVQMELTNTEISLCSFGNGVKGFNKNITVRDIISTYVYPNTLVVKELPGNILKKSLEFNAEFFELVNGEVKVTDRYSKDKLMLYAYDMYDGIVYDINLSKPKGNRIENLTFKDKPLDLDKTYHVVMNNYRASGGGEYMWLKNCKTIMEINDDMIEILINYLAKNKELNIKHNPNIKITYK